MDNNKHLKRYSRTNDFSKLKLARTQDTYRERISLGIACCRLNGNIPEILLVCKRYTYSYNVFVHGRYNSGNSADIIKLFNGMTIEEKIDILSLNFSQIWYRIWLNNTPSIKSNYYILKNKFESAFVADNGLRLKKLMSRSNHSTLKIWEIPKGKKKNRTETDIHCAVREFNEETNIHKKSYKIFPTHTRTYTYIDDNERYTNIYYIAFMRHIMEPNISFNNSTQLDEISDIGFFSIDKIRLLDPTLRLAKFVKPIFNFIKRQCK
jgi:8-oxo-dGTP pyrophosphatase MutT (NUDIX family)